MTQSDKIGFPRLPESRSLAHYLAQGCWACAACEDAQRLSLIVKNRPNSDDRDAAHRQAIGSPVQILPLEPLAEVSQAAGGARCAFLGGISGQNHASLEIHQEQSVKARRLLHHVPKVLVQLVVGDLVAHGVH